MERSIATLAGLALTCVLVLTGCGDDVASDPAGATDSTSPTRQPTQAAMPTAIPAADGPVVGLGLVMDKGEPTGSEFCLGPVAESWPPQCTGLPLEGWVWREHAGEFDRAGDVRFGSFAVTGTFDGAVVTYQSAVSGALYDPMPVPEPTSGAAEQHSAAELQAIADELIRLPGAFSTIPGDNLVVVEVVYDDGSLQEWADSSYGVGLVFVHSALTPASG